METAFSHSPNRFIFYDNLFPHLGDPDEQFGTHNKLPWASKVGQKCSQTKYVSVKKIFEKACIIVTAVFINMLPDDLSTPHTET